MEQLSLAADRHAERRDADASAGSGAIPVVSGRHNRGPLRVLHHGARAGHPAVPAGAERIHSRADLGSDQGMSAEDGETPLWRKIVVNRFVLVPAAIAVAIVLWNLYVSTHDHGVVAGRVVDADGRPVAGATVVLWVLNFTTYVEKTRATTD